MKKPRPITTVDALRVGIFELLVVVIGLVFVRKEIYLSGQFSSMILRWQEYVLLVLMFADGMIRAYGELPGQGDYMSPFRKKLLRYLLPFTLFLYVSCSSLCDKLNAACIHEEWWRDVGVVILAAGVCLMSWSQRTRPAEFSAPVNASIIGMDESGSALAASPDGSESSASTEGSGSSASTEGTASLEGSASSASTEGSASSASTEGSASYASAGSAPVAGSAPSEDSAHSASSEGSASSAGSAHSASSEGSASSAGSASSEGSASSAGSASSEGSASSAGSAPSASAEGAATNGPWNWVRYPGRAATLVELVGISMTLSAWMPLVTLPGLFVLFKWELADLEAFRISQFGQKYLDYKKRSWYLIPYIY